MAAAKPLATRDLARTTMDPPHARPDELRIYLEVAVTFGVPDQHLEVQDRRPRPAPPGRCRVEEVLAAFRE